MGWLTDLTNWIRQQLQALWDALEDFLGDLIVDWADQTFTMWLFVLDHIPLPDFLDGYSLCSLLGQAGPTVGWILNNFRVAEALGLIGAGYVFRLLRKLATLFQW